MRLRVKDQERWNAVKAVTISVILFIALELGAMYVVMNWEQFTVLYK